jgi:hypothetical protein
MPRLLQLIEKGGHAAVPEGYEVTTPEALALAEFDLIVHDLSTAKTSLEIIYQQAQGEATPSQMHICQALFRDAVVQFVECFGKHGLNDKDVYQNVNGGLETIEYFKRLRDGYAAHRFGAGRQCAVVVTELAPDQFAFGRFHLMMGIPSPAILPDYISFVEVAIKAARSRADELSTAVAQQLDVMTAAEIRALKRLAMRTPDGHEFKYSRGQFRGEKGSRSQAPSGPPAQKP